MSSASRWWVCTPSKYDCARTKGHLDVYECHVGVEGGGCLQVGGDQLLQGQRDGRLVFDALVDVGEDLEYLRPGCVHFLFWASAYLGFGGLIGVVEEAEDLDQGVIKHLLMWTRCVNMLARPFAYDRAVSRNAIDTSPSLSSLAAKAIRIKMPSSSVP